MTVWDKARGTGFTLRAFEDQFPQIAHGNLEAEPEFADAEEGDFRLAPESPCVDAGGPLTQTRSAGDGTTIEVNDALFFSDGFGVVEPDTIRVGERRVRVVKVDFAHHRLTIDRRISWRAGEPVTLDYRGKAPDLGAVESEQ